MKQFVFGLGNPGEEYQRTRHNVGYQVINALTTLLTGQIFPQVAKEHHKTHSLFYRTGEIFLAESTTYMNDSGKAVLGVLDYFDKDLVAALKAGKPAGTADQPALIVIYDDLDIPVGQLKVQFGKGPKVHNGVNSIRQHLGTDLFLHVRIGVDGRNGVRTLAGRDYVLTPFLGEEVSQVGTAIDAACTLLQQRLR